MSKNQRRERLTEARSRSRDGAPISVSISETQEIAEIFPDPETLRLYQGLGERYAERIFDFTEREQSHRHRVDIGIVRLLTRGQYFAFITALAFLVGGVYLAVMDKEVQSYFSMAFAMGPIIISFLASRGK